MTSTAYTYAPYFADGLHTAPFSPPLYDTFAIFTCPGMGAVASEFDRAR